MAHECFDVVAARERRQYVIKRALRLLLFALAGGLAGKQNRIETKTNKKHTHTHTPKTVEIAAAAAAAGALTTDCPT